MNSVDHSPGRTAPAPPVIRRVESTRGSLEELAALIAMLAELPAEVDQSVVERRVWLESFTRERADRYPVGRCTIAGVAAERHAGGGEEGRGAILYAHGGAYVVGSAATNRELAWAIAGAVGAPVVAADYRLAPEHPFPAGRDDLVAVYREMVEQWPAVALVGDSAGAGLVVAAACTIRDAGLPPPAALVCLSPWSDLELTQARRHGEAGGDPLVSLEGLDADAKRYAGATSLRDASPCRGDLRGLPAVLIQVGSAERLLQDALALADRLADGGTPVTVEIWQDMIHGWHLFRDELPEANRAIDSLAAMLTTHLRAGEHLDR